MKRGVIALPAMVAMGGLGLGVAAAAKRANIMPFGTWTGPVLGGLVGGLPGALGGYIHDNFNNMFPGGTIGGSSSSGANSSGLVLYG